jgi:3-hydroxybutyryl-CoA dehydrogenase
VAISPSEKTVGVAGLGTMGAGIAEVCLRAGFNVRAYEPSESLLHGGRASIEASLEKAVERGKATAQERDEALARLLPTTSLADFADCHAVLEAVTEDLDVKTRLIAQFDEEIDADCLIATNTSALSVTAIAGASARPERVVGLHFFNPAQVLPLVEIVRTDLASDVAIERAQRLVEEMGKTPVHCVDTPGFIVNRILIPLLNDAVRALDEGAADPASIDAAMTLGTNWPIGPLALIDLIGIDVQVHASDALWKAYRETRFAPPPRLRRMIDAGHLGRKSGRGFFEYETR